MTGVARIPRSRGGVSGVLLILLGAWGGLAPFVGPYFHYAYTPDKAWAYTSGRLWLSIAPGAAALIGGLLVVLASHRGVGILGALLAALGGAWFIVGARVTVLVVTNGSISPGIPLAGATGSLSSATRQFLESLGFFTGTGVLIVFLAALALGRFSVVSLRDAALAEDAGMAYPAGSDSAPGSATFPATTGEFPAVGSQYPGAGESEGTAAAEYPTAAAEYPTAAEEYPTAASPFRPTPPSDPGPLRGPS
jgi:hypothetical protein